MTLEQFEALKSGDVIRHKDTGTRLTVVASSGGLALFARLPDGTKQFVRPTLAGYFDRVEPTLTEHASRLAFLRWAGEGDSPEALELETQLRGKASGRGL